MKIVTPKIFIGKKTKGRYATDTTFFTGEVSLENITRFFDGVVVSHELILSKAAELYDPLGFASPLKVFGNHIARRALIESNGNPLKEVSQNTRQLFLQYVYQVKMLDTLTFKRKKYDIAPAETDVLILMTDAGYEASIMILYLGHQTTEGMKLEFIFSVGYLNSNSSNIPRHEIDIIDRGTVQCERILEWLTTKIKRKIFITDSKVALSWLRNPSLRTQPYV